MLDAQLCLDAVTAFTQQNIAAGTHTPWQGPCGLAINCLPFDDPNRDKSASRHCGAHPRILQHLGTMQGALDSMEMLGGELARLYVSQETRTVLLFFVCKRGKHRSVAMSVALRLAIWTDPRFAVDRVVQLTDLGQTTACGLCTACSQFPLNVPNRLEAAGP
jgi:hypothetical protein